MTLQNQELKIQKSNILIQLNNQQEEITHHKKLIEKKESYPNILTRIEKNETLDDTE